MGVHQKVIPMGTRFGRLVVTDTIRWQKGKDWRGVRSGFVCLCDCGKTRVVAGYKLRSSCGCLKSDALADPNNKHRKYEFDKKELHKEYMTWIRMRRRCENPESQDYANYGGRGIMVCRRWSDIEKGFINFLEDMGRRPGIGYSLDRIDNDGDYHPGNCRWATILQQNRNKRTARLITIGEVTQGLPEWSDESGINQNTIRGRLVRGWSPEEAVFGTIRQIMERVGNRWSKRK